ncbi:hypothetical protein EYC80_004417 [Monilinia laxa]|uniref:Uncharacterized protein n=1 Tax=Monilinia laxa TaxID=61186 RepID=A0A5N6KN65_MONLA|nr:hypothetical protein EYC80_004417 [Monilinia laxa]
MRRKRGEGVSCSFHPSINLSICVCFPYLSIKHHSSISFHPSNSPSYPDLYEQRQSQPPAPIATIQTIINMS